MNCDMIWVRLTVNRARRLYGLPDSWDCTRDIMLMAESWELSWDDVAVAAEDLAIMAKHTQENQAEIDGYIDHMNRVLGGHHARV